MTALRPPDSYQADRHGTQAAAALILVVLGLGCTVSNPEFREVSRRWDANGVIDKPMQIRAIGGAVRIE